MDFNSEILLAKHLGQYHSDVKYGCYFCKRQFQHHTVLLHHMKTTHGLQGPPDYAQIALFKAKYPSRIIGYMKTSTDNPQELEIPAPQASAPQASKRPAPVNNQHNFTFKIPKVAERDVIEISDDEDEAETNKNHEPLQVVYVNEDIIENDGQDIQIGNIRSLNSVLNTSAQDDDPNLILVCDECLDVFPSRTALNEHMEEKHALETRIVITDECTERYDYVKMGCHVKSIDKMRVRCVICNGVIYTDETPMHFTKNHPDFCIEKKWPSCDKCYRPCLFFPSNWKLERHIEEVHGGALGSSLNTVPKSTSIEVRTKQYNYAKKVVDFKPPYNVKTVQASSSRIVYPANMVKLTFAGSNKTINVPLNSKK
jgi:hypothetical protein